MLYRHRHHFYLHSFPTRRSSDLFMHVDLMLAEGRTLDVITQAETLSPFAARLGSDYALYTAGTAMLETAERLVGEDGDPAVQQRSEEHTSELQSRFDLVCRLLLE